MKRGVVIVAVIASLAGCRNHGPPAAAYQDWRDQIAVATGISGLGLAWPCMVKEQTDFGPMYATTPVDQCYKMEPQRRWTGLWRYEFEGSRFCPAPATDCRIDSPGDIIWLDADRLTRGEPYGALYAVEFVGRRTQYKGNYGHMRASDHYLIVDGFTSIRKVGDPLTEAENNAAMQRCRTGARCSAFDN